MTKADLADDTRTPRRWIDKQQATRHLIHSAIDKRRAAALKECRQLTGTT
jgi:hypothetical protein